MKQTLGRFLLQENRNFPLDCETFDYIQTNMAMLAVLGNIAGDKTVIQGCTLSHNNIRREPGYVFLKTADYPDGEIIYWEGGSITSGMYVKQEVLQVTVQGYEYPQAYVVRSLAPGIGIENYVWNDFRDIRNVRQLNEYDTEQDKAIQLLSPPPMGIIQMWAGTRTPENYELCEGQQLKVTDYEELYAVLGSTFNKSYDYNGNLYSTSAGYFRLPDLRGRFVVGYNVNDAEYSSLGKIGGEKKHALTSTEMPAHSHGQNLWSGASDDWSGSGRNSWPNATSWHDRTTPFGNTDSTGGGMVHENRPPYYTLAYVMRIK
ncbi:MAG: tail fiber protein [Alistipes sp.]